MIDRIFSALLTFCLLAGGTVAIGSALVGGSAQATPVVMLPPVTVIGVREPAATPVARNETSAEPSARALQ